MANTVYDVEQITLQDGKEVELKPVNIRHLREFMVKMEEFGKTGEDEDKALEILLDAAAICLKKQVPEYSTDREKLEDALDMPTVYKILDVCGGVKLNDPNLLAAAMAEVGKD